jgi:L-arabinokinase
MSFEHELSERAAFLRLVHALTASDGGLAGFFRAGTAIGVARAPGRLDVMGGFADYSGSLVLELPIAEAAFAAVQYVPEPGIVVASVDPLNPSSIRRVALDARAWLADGYAGARRLLAELGGDAWPGYIAGVLVPLVHELGFELAGGARLLVASRVPEGKGVSSSAAVEVASFFAAARAAGLEIAPEAAALACQRVENLVAGAPCGVMDQLTAACGQRGRLLEILCQPASIRDKLFVPAELAFFGVDSGVRHAVSGADYGEVRVGAFMGYRMIAAWLGLASEPAGDGRSLRISDPRFSGFLANLGVSEFEREFAPRLPEKMGGAEFLATFGGISDPVTLVRPDKVYPVRASTAHPIYEHERVRAFVELLRGEDSESTRRRLGELMRAAHASYSACGLGSDATDQLVSLADTEDGVYGAKITGGGSGGTVVFLARADAESGVRRIAERYGRSSGRSAHVFVGSSAGCAELGATLEMP